MEIANSYGIFTFWFFRIEIDTKLPVVGDQKWVIWICSFNIPMSPGKTRSIVCSARNFFQFTVPGPKWWQVFILSPLLNVIIVADLSVMTCCHLLVLVSIDIIVWVLVKIIYLP